MVIFQQQISIKDGVINVHVVNFKMDFLTILDIPRHCIFLLSQVVRYLVEMGFDEADVIDALRISGNKEEQAVSFSKFYMNSCDFFNISIYRL